MEKMSVEQLSKSYEEVNKKFQEYVKRVTELRIKDQFLNRPVLRVFISVPMSGRGEAEVAADIEEAKAAFNKFFGLDFDGDCVEFVNTFVQEEAPDECRKDRVWHLGNSIKILSTCDVVLFAKNSYRAKGCNVEDDISDSYGIPSIRIDEKRKGDTRDFNYINGHLTLLVPDKDESKPKYMTKENYEEWMKVMDEKDRKEWLKARNEVDCIGQR